MLITLENSLDNDNNALWWLIIGDGSKTAWQKSEAPAVFQGIGPRIKDPGSTVQEIGSTARRDADKLG